MNNEKTGYKKCYFVNTVKSLVEEFYGKILLVIYVEIRDLGY